MDFFAGQLNDSFFLRTYREVGLIHYGFLKYRNETHKEAWFRKMNRTVNAIMFILIVRRVQQSLLNEG